MPNDALPEGGKISIASEQNHGAVYKPLHVERQVKIFPIQEHELGMLATLNNQVALWCSIGSLATALLLSCVWDVLNLPGKELPSKNACGFMLVCAAVAIGSFIAAYRFKSSGKTTLDKILAETVR